MFVNYEINVCGSQSGNQAQGLKGIIHSLTHSPAFILHSNISEAFNFTTAIDRDPSCFLHDHTKTLLKILYAYNQENHCCKF